MRFVSLCPSLTELVFHLGRGGDLVGRTRYCVRPAGEVEAVEAVGGTKNPKLERIREIAPDLVLLNEEENRREDAEALAEAGIPCWSFFPRNPEETAAMVREVGDVLDRPEEADRLAAEIEAAVERAREAARGRPPVPFAYLIWRKPWMVAAGGTYVDSLLTLAGGRNVFAGNGDSDGNRYPAVTAEKLAAADPQVVLLSTEPFPFEEKHIPELVDATRLPAERFRIADGQLLSWHGASTPAGVQYAVEVLRPAR